jgi:hypothetical protein
MPRLHLIEFHEMPWFPKTWRDVVTDLLCVFSIHMDPYASVCPRLVAAINREGSDTIVDLCSGGRGPWPVLQTRLEDSGWKGTILLTDKYPHRVESTGKDQAGERLRYAEESVDALAVPEGIRGFRTLFASFHHFREPDAQRILMDAVHTGTSIAVLEYTKRSFPWMLSVLLSPIYFWIYCPFVLRPFHWRHLLWIYLLPIPMLVMVWDGIISSLRTYSTEELRDLAIFPGSDLYAWDIGKASSSGSRSVTYLIAVPKDSAGG